MRIVAGIRNSHPHLSCLAVTLLCFKAFSPLSLEQGTGKPVPRLICQNQSAAIMYIISKLTYPERFAYRLITDPSRISADPLLPSEHPL